MILYWSAFNQWLGTHKKCGKSKWSNYHTVGPGHQEPDKEADILGEASVSYRVS